MKRLELPALLQVTVLVRSEWWGPQAGLPAAPHQLPAPGGERGGGRPAGRPGRGDAAPWQRQALSGTLLPHAQSGPSGSSAASVRLGSWSKMSADLQSKKDKAVLAVLRGLAGDGACAGRPGAVPELTSGDLPCWGVGGRGQTPGLLGPAAAATLPRVL